jgi:hypothetical protein
MRFSKQEAGRKPGDTGKAPGRPNFPAIDIKVK